MANMMDARILYTIWARHFDPVGAPFERLSYAQREAWLLVAAGARMLNDLPEPAPHLTPGHLFLATWHPRDSWKGDAPHRPAVSFVLDGSPHTYTVEMIDGDTPTIHTCPIKPSEFRRIPGLIYEEDRRPEALLIEPQGE